MPVRLPPPTYTWPAVAAIAVLRQRRSTIWRASGDLVHPHLALEAVGEADDNHLQVQQHDVGRQDRGLLAAMLAPSRGEDAAGLTKLSVWNWL